MAKRSTAASGESTETRAKGRAKAAALSGHNKVDLRGQVTGDPRLRTFESGAALFTFNLRVPGRAGRFTSVPVCVWDADVAGADVVEGDVVRVRGALVRRFWADPAGGRRSVVEVVADEVTPASRPGPS